jgi:hypothetical protein
LLPFKLYNKFLSGFAKGAIAMVPFHWIEFPDEPPKSLGSRLTDDRECGRTNKNIRGERRCYWRGWDKLKNGRVPREIAVYGCKNSVLVIPLRLVPWNSGHAEFVEDG